MTNTFRESHTPGDNPRVFVDPSSYTFSNIGDTAMLEVALQRLRSIWPGARLIVHSVDSGMLSKLDPEAESFDPYGSVAWSADEFLLDRTTLPADSVVRMSESCHALRRRHPWLMQLAAGAALACHRRDPRRTHSFLKTIRTSDLVMLTGSGSLNDSFKQHAMMKLETLELAIESGAVTALVGQGLGPMTDPRLRRRAAAVLPHVDFISLRDGLASLALLQSMGVPSSRISTTGDDAVSLGYEARQVSFGSAIGVNMRIATYAGINEGIVRRIGDVLRDAAATVGAPLLAVPIERFADHDDAQTIRLLLGVDTMHGDLNRYPATPTELLAILPACRIVVTGSYHAAVLALSMGIPAVAIASSEYYVHKFQGLADQFSGACRLELTSDPDFFAHLRTAIATAWSNAEAVRSELLKEARRQIARSVAAYRTIYELTESRRLDRFRR